MTLPPSGWRFTPPGAGQLLDGRVQGILEAGVQRQEVRHREQAEGLGDSWLGPAEQEAGGRPAAGGVVGHGGEDGGADRIKLLDAGQVADQRRGLPR